MENMENKVVIFKVVVGVDGSRRKTTVDNFKDQAQAFLDAFKTRKDDVRDAIALLAHEYVLYKKNRRADWKPSFKALKEAQKSVAEMNRFLTTDFRQFKSVWKPYQVDPTYGIIYRAIEHYWPKFYGTVDVDGCLQYVTFYSDELPKIRYVERDED